MAQVFPDEILVKIARSCVEPYHIAVSCKANRCRVKNVSDIRTSVGKLNGHSNLKLVNGLFDDEISAIMHHKFNGQLQIGAFDWEQDMDFNEVVSIFARPHCGLSLQGHIAGCLSPFLPQVCEIKCRAIDSCVVESAFCYQLPNLQKITCRHWLLQYPPSRMRPYEYSLDLADARAGRLDSWVIDEAHLFERFNLSPRFGIRITCSVSVYFMRTDMTMTFHIDLSSPAGEHVMDRVMH